MWPVARSPEQSSGTILGQVLPDGSIIEMKIWEVPESVPGSRHRLKYSLFYGRPGQRLIGYDNERGRGDHRHVEGKQQPYTFSARSS
jgi:hypothetical protein